MADIKDRLDRLESLVDKQQAIIERHQETIAEQAQALEAVHGQASASPLVSGRTTRRSILAAGGTLALLGLGSTSVAASDPTGQIGTADRPLEALHAQDVYAGAVTNADWSDANDLDADGNVDLPDPGRYLDADDELDFVGAAEWENLGDVNTNTASGLASVAVGGEDNDAGGEHSAVGGGINNQATGNRATVSGGNNNSATHPSATVGGGTSNTAGNATSTVAGGISNAASGARASIGGGRGNEASGDGATVAGGGAFNAGNEASGYEAAIGGGRDNVASGDWVTVGGGVENVASDEHATVSGGQRNEASGNDATVAGGQDNTASGRRAAIGGGHNNDATEGDAVVAGGSYNEASGFRSTVVGGTTNTASGDYSFATGHFASAEHEGSYVFGDSSTTEFFSNDEDTAYFQMEVHADDFVNNSSVQMKDNIDPVDSQSILAGIRELDISEWEFLHDEGKTHIGPMAEDFHEQFDLGTDETKISNIDANGVALAAIQGLAEELDDRSDHIERLQDEHQELLARLNALEAQVAD